MKFKKEFKLWLLKSVADNDFRSSRITELCDGLKPNQKMGVELWSVRSTISDDYYLVIH